MKLIINIKLRTFSKTKYKINVWNWNINSFLGTNMGPIGCIPRELDTHLHISYASENFHFHAILEHWKAVKATFVSLIINLSHTTQRYAPLTINQIATLYMLTTLIPTSKQQQRSSPNKKNSTPFQLISLCWWVHERHRGSACLLWLPVPHSIRKALIFPPFSISLTHTWATD